MSVELAKLLHALSGLGCSRLALQGARQAATEEVFGADGGERPRHLERDIDGIFADFSRHRA